MIQGSHKAASWAAKIMIFGDFVVGGKDHDFWRF
jgi:hypothetical protein